MTKLVCSGYYVLVRKHNYSVLTDEANGEKSVAIICLFKEASSIQWMMSLLLLPLHSKPFFCLFVTLLTFPH